MKILAVDDDDAVLDILTAVMTQADYTDLETAGCAKQALDMILSSPKPFECFLLDIRMPGMDGIELCREIRAMPDYQSVPIIMITVVTDPESIDRANQAGATDYVTKPFNGLELGARLRAAGILNSVLHRHNEYKATTQSLEKRLSRMDAIKLEDAVQLDPVPDVITQLELENRLLKLPPGVYGLEIMAFSVVNIADIFSSLPQTQFRTFLNLVADRILREFEPRQSSVAYAGNGIFAVVHNTAKTPKKKRTTAAISTAIGAQSFSILRDLGLEIQVAWSKPKHPDVWSGQEAAAGVSKAIRSACINSLYCLAQSKLSDYREILSEGKPKRTAQRPFLDSLRTFGESKNRVFPQRIKASGQKAERPVERSTHSRQQA